MSVRRINNECVKNREARIGIDLVKDEVENSLEREVENIKTYQQRMQKMLARVNQQIETNHSMQVTTPSRRGFHIHVEKAPTPARAWCLFIVLSHLFIHLKPMDRLLLYF